MGRLECDELIGRVALIHHDTSIGTPSDHHEMTLRNVRNKKKNGGETDTRHFSLAHQCHDAKLVHARVHQFSVSSRSQHCEQISPLTHQCCLSLRYCCQRQELFLCLCRWEDSSDSCSHFEHHAESLPRASSNIMLFKVQQHMKMSLLAQRSSRHVLVPLCQQIDVGSRLSLRLRHNGCVLIRFCQCSASFPHDLGDV